MQLLLLLRSTYYYMRKSPGLQVHYGYDAHLYRTFFLSFSYYIQGHEKGGGPMMAPRCEQLAMISVPWQEYTTPMAPAEALRCGSVFCELSQPYTPLACNQPPQNAQMLSNMQKKR